MVRQPTREGLDTAVRDPRTCRGSARRRGTYAWRRRRYRVHLGWCWESAVGCPIAPELCAREMRVTAGAFMARPLQSHCGGQATNVCAASSHCRRRRRKTACSWCREYAASLPMRLPSSLPARRPRCAADRVRGGGGSSTTVRRPPPNIRPSASMHGRSNTVCVAPSKASGNAGQHDRAAAGVQLASR